MKINIEKMNEDYSAKTEPHLARRLSIEDNGNSAKDGHTLICTGCKNILHDTMKLCIDANNAHNFSNLAQL